MNIQVGDIVIHKETQKRAKIISISSKVLPIHYTIQFEDNINVFVSQEDIILIT